MSPPNTHNPDHHYRLHYTRGAFSERLRRGDTYSLLLCVIIASYIVVAVLQRSLWERFIVTVVLGFTFLLTLHTSHVRERGFRVGIALVGFATISTFLQALFDHKGNDGSTFIIFVLVLSAPVVILNRILRHETIGTETILGAVCVYVMLGIAFAGIYQACDNFDHGTFFTQPGIQSNIEFLYFSFITMTTVGYGDLTTATDGGRVLVTIEALLGQVFLVTLVARLVSMYGTNRAPLGADLATLGNGDDGEGSEGDEEFQ
ncbi:MAG: ion channel [Acidimicrobiia bacterium]